MNGVDRTSFHAMWFRAGPTGSRDHEVIQTLPSPEQARDRNPVCPRSVLLDTASRTRVAARAVIQVEHKNALTFVKTLLDILVENSVTHRRAVETRESLLDDPSAKDVKLAQHLKKIGPAKLRQLQLIQRGTRRRTQPRWKQSSDIVAGLLELVLQRPVDFFDRPAFVIQGKGQQSDLSENGFPARGLAARLPGQDLLRQNYFAGHKRQLGGRASARLAGPRPCSLPPRGRRSRRAARS